MIELQWKAMAWQEISSPRYLEILSHVWLLGLSAAHLHVQSPWQSTWQGDWQIKRTRFETLRASTQCYDARIQLIALTESEQLTFSPGLSCVIPLWIERISFWQLKKILSKWCLFKTSLCPVLSKLPPHTSSCFLFNFGKLDLKFLFYYNCYKPT